MVNDLLDLSRLEAGRESLRLQPVDLAAVLGEVATAFRPNDATHHLALDLEPNLPHITGHRDRLVQVVTNLVDNAVKYSPQGGEIIIAARREADAIHVEVRDQGIGIPAHDLETIFDRYARVETEGTRRIRGTGLGLSIVREIIGAHGGRVWAESEPSGGSTFHVILPTSAASQTRPMLTGDAMPGTRSPEKEQIVQSATSHGSPNVLTERVVDAHTS
jgi:two-component system phosphate regulon sensor histidine kinase PhoR